jgi:hypothetical protein
MYLTVVTTAQMTAIASATEKAANTKRGAMTRAPLYECHADPRLPAPDNEAMLALLAGDNIQCDFVVYAYGARHVQRRSGLGHVADGAIDPAAVELNRSGLEDPLPLCCASLFHCIAFKLKV